MKTLIWLNVVFLVNVHGALERVDPLVLIEQGLVKGIKASDGDYSKFLGIPYAAVDLADPFGPARDAPKFEDEIFNADDNSKSCPQNGSENESLDCLQLNIHVPYRASSRNTLPVLVWIHGGGFRGGSGNEFEAPNLVKQDIVVVTINYRLGAYGFMCLDDPAVPGNQGLKDVHTALQWVRSNIAAFGGNPYNVTIAGQSAGSAIALLQLFSPREKLFHKIIAQSGTPLSPDMFVKGDPNTAVKLANHLGLNTTDNKQALEFLAQTHHSLVTGASTDLRIDFKPCTEGSFSVDSFVETDPYSFSNERKIQNTPILIGRTDEEYLSTSGHSIKTMHEEDFLRKDFFYSRLSEKFNLEKDQQEKAAEILRHFYIGDKPISEAVEKEAEYFLSDFVFYHPIEDTVTSLIKNNAGPVYEYAFTFVGDSGAVGAAHGDELQYLFKLSGPIEAKTEVDPVTTDRMVTLWSNFIKYGNPLQGDPASLSVDWTPVTLSTRPYLNIGSELRMEDRFFKERTAFWDLFQSIYGQYSYLIRQ